MYIDISHVDLQCMSFSPPFFFRYERKPCVRCCEAWSDRASCDSCATFLLIVLCGIAGGRGRPWGFCFLVIRYKHHIILAIGFNMYNKLGKTYMLCYYVFFFFGNMGRFTMTFLKCYNKHLPFAIPTESPDVHQWWMTKILWPRYGDSLRFTKFQDVTVINQDSMCSIILNILTLFFKFGT